MEVYDIIKSIMTQGKTSKPRGLEIKEINYFSSEIHNPWSNYPARQYPMDYFKREMQWYLHADMFDKRIIKHAKTWEKIVQKQGIIFSNYGYYWFGKQQGYKTCLNILQEDPNSRQSYLPMCNYHHMFKGNNDVVCTKGIQFRIIDNKLYMHVSMRSSDAIFGLATDLPCFYTLMCMMSFDLKVPLGKFIFSADSVHIYKPRYKMALDILNKDKTQIYYEIPKITSTEDLINETYKSPFGLWLTQVKL